MKEVYMEKQKRRQIKKETNNIKDTKKRHNKDTNKKYQI